MGCNQQQWWDFIGNYPLVNIQKTMENHHFLIGKSTINYRPFSIAMLVITRGFVGIYWI